MSNDLTKARAAVHAALARDGIAAPSRWRVIITDSESPTGVAPVCTEGRSNALHVIDDYPGGPERDEDGVYDCCPWPQFDTYSQDTAAYLVALLNADAAAPLHAGCRADALAEVTAWLVKKAREFHASSRKREREQGDTCAVLASKIARGAVRPDNLRMLPDAGFFEVDRSYVSGTWQFRCEAITPSPGTGEVRALGWKRSPVYDVHLWHAVALDPDDWKHGEWTADTGTEGTA